MSIQSELLFSSIQPETSSNAVYNKRHASIASNNDSGEIQGKVIFGRGNH